MPGRGLSNLPGLVADPQLAAAVPQLDPPGRRAPNPRGLGFGTEGHAADGSVHTQALVFTAGLEALSVPVDHTVVLAACAHHVCMDTNTTEHTSPAEI